MTPFKLGDHYIPGVALDRFPCISSNGCKARAPGCISYNLMIAMLVNDSIEFQLVSCCSNFLRYTLILSKTVMDGPSLQNNSCMCRMASSIRAPLSRSTVQYKELSPILLRTDIKCLFAPPIHRKRPIGTARTFTCEFRMKASIEIMKTKGC